MAFVGPQSHPVDQGSLVQRLPVARLVGCPQLSSGNKVETEAKKEVLPSQSIKSKRGRETRHRKDQCNF